jgi:uncharacterized protein YrrD
MVGVKTKGVTYMRLAKELINKPVFTIANGQEIGKVKDIYLDGKLRHMTAIYLGSDGLFSRSESFIRHADIVTLGRDAILIQEADDVLEESETPEVNEWLTRWKRRDDMKGRELQTPGGTKIGRLGDIILDEKANIAGFSLSQSFVSGPVADNKAVSRSAMIEPEQGKENGVMMIDLAEAEEANLKVEYESFLSSEPTVSVAEDPQEMKVNV